MNGAPEPKPLAWTQGSFEGNYVGDVVHEDPPRAATRRYGLTLVKAVLRNTRPVASPPPTDDTRPLFRQAKLESCFVALDDAPNPKLKLTAIYDVQVHDWVLLEGHEVQGRAYGRIRGTLYGRTKAPVVSLGARTFAALRAADSWSSRALPLATMAALFALAPTCGAAAAGSSITWCFLALPLLALAFGRYRHGAAGEGGRFRWRAHVSRALTVLSILFLFGSYERTCVETSEAAESWASQGWHALTDHDDSAIILSRVPPDNLDPVVTRLTVENAAKQPDAFFNDQRRHIYLATDLMFESGSAALREPVSPELGQLAKLLLRIAGRRVVIAGHADTLGVPQENLTLSRQRAEAVRKWLVDQGHVNPNQLTATGLGSTHPLVNPQGTSDEQRPNRRVEVEIQ